MEVGGVECVQGNIQLYRSPLSRTVHIYVCYNAYIATVWGLASLNCTFDTHHTWLSCDLLQMTMIYMFALLLRYHIHITYF